MLQFEEMYAPEINDFVYITDNAFTSKEIRQMELKYVKLGSVGAQLGALFVRPTVCP